MIVINDVIEKTLKDEAEYAAWVSKQVAAEEIDESRASVLLSSVVSRMWRLINAHKRIGHVADRWAGEGEVELMVECETDAAGEDVSFWAYQQNGRSVDVTDLVFALSPDDAESIIEAVLEDIDPREMRYPDTREEA